MLDRCRETDQPQAKEREMSFSSIRSSLLQKFLKGLSKLGNPLRLTHFRGLFIQVRTEALARVTLEGESDFSIPSKRCQYQ